MSTPVNRLFDLTGRTALVTGGSRGLGLQIAESLGEAGAKILLTSRKAADLEQATADLQAKGIDARWVAADASQPDDAQRVVAEAMARLGRIDILVNNAGATWGAPAEDHPLAAWDKVMNLNIRSLFVFSQAIAKLSMIPRRQGRIINIASIAGLAGNPPGMETLAYNTSKGAVISFLHRYTAGIRPTQPGYRTFEIRPRPGGGVTWDMVALDSAVAPAYTGLLDLTYATPLPE